ncbi:MAG: ArnT family glycosyltransferase, partial [Gemmataceae bacterium]
MDRSGAARLPASLTDWIADLWSRQLFPGPCKGDDSPPSLRSLAILVVLPAILLYPCLGFHLFEPDESRYAQIPREMLDRSDLIVPTLQGEPYLDKPPLFYWMVMLSYRIFGAHDWSARLVPAIAAHLTLLLTYLLGRRTMGERPAFWAALVLALAPGFLGMSRLLILDGLLTLFVTLALFAGYEALRGNTLRKGWWLLASVAVGLAVLTKGPVALLLFLPPLWLHRRLSGKGCVPSRGDLVLFGLIVLAITLPWYIALSLRVPEFVRYFFWEHNVKRFLAPDVHVRGIWFYFPILWLVLFPTTLLLLPVARYLSRLTPEDADRRSVHLGFHLLAGGWCVLFFTLSACKLPTYILPALPFLALGLGAFLVETDWQSSRLFRHSLQASFALMMLGHYLVLPWYAWYRSPMSRPADVLAL